MFSMQYRFKFFLFKKQLLNKPLSSASLFYEKNMYNEGKWITYN